MGELDREGRAQKSTFIPTAGINDSKLEHTIPSFTMRHLQQSEWIMQKQNNKAAVCQTLA